MNWIILTIQSFRLTKKAKRETFLTECLPFGWFYCPIYFLNCILTYGVLCVGIFSTAPSGSRKNCLTRDSGRPHRLSRRCGCFAEHFCLWQKQFSLQYYSLAKIKNHPFGWFHFGWGIGIFHTLPCAIASLTLVAHVGENSSPNCFLPKA